WSSPTAMDGLTAFSVANDGTFAYRRGGIARFQLVFRDREGKKLGTVGTPTFSSGPRLSADLRRVFFDVVETVKNSTAVVSIDTETGRQTRLTFGTGNDTTPLVSPDGRTIVFSSDARGPFDIYSVDATGNAVAPLLSNESWKHPESWSPDGRYLAYKQIDPATKWDIWVLPLSGDKKPFPFVKTPADEQNAAFSPDGRFLAYDSDEAGPREVFVQPFPATGAKWQVSVSGGSGPCWAKDSRELFYMGSDGRLTAVPIKSSSASELVFGTPRPLFATPAVTSSSGRQYDVSPDGQRFLLNEPVGLETASPIVVVIPGAGSPR
ncbi:MAG TPA: hypothetical protein VKF32_13200, partial [Thermoanaerobaculia bacterium]|nr:hypothetical protein [Thermoanaerobaculia bacterium]